MSRIGNKLIKIPEGLNVSIDGDIVDIKGKIGEDKIKFDKNYVDVEINDGIIKVTRKNEEKHTKQMHGTTRALLHNAIVGCHDGFTKELEIIGIGYRAELKGEDLVLYVGYSHPVTIHPLEGVKITLKDPTHVSVTGSDKFKVGQVSALIHDTRKPEPYQGKGIKYKGEVIIRKEGKRAGAGGGK
jgi:large subunit ribosomal protein L6